jgi:hypothetical protein
MSNLITYADKSSPNPLPNIPDNWVSANANEVKDVVNTNSAETASNTANKLNSNAVPLQLAGAYSDEESDLEIKQVWSKRIGIGFDLTGHKFDVITAPTGSTIIIDVKKNGVSIWSVKPVIAASSFVETAGTLLVNPTVFAVGDLFTTHIDQVGASVVGAGLKGDPIGVLT